MCPNLAPKVVEFGTAAAVGCSLARVVLPALDDEVAIGRIDFDDARLAARALGCNDHGPAAGEGVEDKTTAARAIPYGIGHKGNRLHSRMHSELGSSLTLEGIHARII